MDPELIEFIALVRQLRTLEKQYAQKRDSAVMYKIHYTQNQIDVRLEKIPVPQEKTVGPPTSTQGAIF